MVTGDETRPVRPGEELDLARLEPYLRERVEGLAGAVAIEQFPHGHSNLTYLLRSGERELVLRRPPFGNVVKSAHDMRREYRVLSKLCEVYALAPRPYFYCSDEGVIGAPFYIMERRRGVILRGKLPPGLSLDSDTMRRLSASLVDNFARLHALDYQAAGLADLGKPDGYVARQITGWTNRYRQAQTDDVPAMDRVASWLAANMPTESGAAIIHNDYKHDNLVLDPQDPARIVAVLDWEMCTIGDPLMDLGSTLGYWVEAGDSPPLREVALGPSILPGSFTRREFVDRYVEQSGREVRTPHFYYCYGLFKLAVIIQQIYARYVRGHTRDERFARFDERVAVISQEALRVADESRISQV